MAVSVEDRDQVYSFVDVRDVVVLDPDVGCHAGCLLRGAVDAFTQQGWEFSVQVGYMWLRRPLGRAGGSFMVELARTCLSRWSPSLHF